MKMKRSLAILLATTLAFALLAGCGDTGGETSDAPSNSAEQSGGAEQSNSPGTARDTAEPGSSEDGSVSLPLVEETVTITAWMPITQAFTNLADGYDDNVAIQELQRVTNVDIEFTNIPSDQKNALFMIMAAGQDLTDLMQDVGNLYTTGLTGAWDDEIIADLTDIIPEKAPNYYRMINELSCVADVSNDDGQLLSFSTLFNNGNGITTGLAIRKDWLDDLGLGLPETYDDWYNTLTAFKAYNGSTMWATSSGTLSYNYLSSGYGTLMYVSDIPGSEAPFYVENGEAKYGPLNVDAAVEYLTMMNQWWNEGLIYPDFLSVSAPFAADTTPLVDDSCSLAVVVGGMLPSLGAMSSDPDFQLWPIQDAVKTAGDTHEFGARPNKGSTMSGMSISATTERLDICLAFMDFLYSEEGSEIANYGILGESYEIDGSGVKRYTDFMTKNPEQSFSNMRLLYTSAQSLRGIEDNAPVFLEYSDAESAALELWNKHGNSMRLTTNLSMTPDESSTYALTYSDIQSFAATALVEFVLGQRPISAYQEFVDQLYSMGIETCIAMRQAAYNRYIKR